MATASSTSEVEDIRRQMALIRHELHEDVKGVVEGAEAATDWRRYVRSYPWASVGVAFAVGYLIVPKRHRTPAVLKLAPAELAKAVAAEVPKVLPAPTAPALAPEPPKKKESGQGLVRSAFGLVAPLAFRAIKGYALQFAEQWLAQRMAQQQSGGFGDLAAAFGVAPPGPPPQGPTPHGSQTQGPQARPRF